MRRSEHRTAARLQYTADADSSGHQWWYAHADPDAHIASATDADEASEWGGMHGKRDRGALESILCQRLLPGDDSKHRRSVCGLESVRIVSNTDSDCRKFTDTDADTHATATSDADEASRRGSVYRRCGRSSL